MPMSLCLFFYPHSRTFSPLLLKRGREKRGQGERERERERGRGRERRREKHQCDRETSFGHPLKCTMTRDQTHKAGKCPDWELNLSLFGPWDDSPTNWATPARAITLSLTRQSCGQPSEPPQHCVNRYRCSPSRLIALLHLLLEPFQQFFKLLIPCVKSHSAHVV